MIDRYQIQIPHKRYLSNKYQHANSLNSGVPEKTKWSRSTASLCVMVLHQKCAEGSCGLSLKLSTERINRYVSLLIENLDLSNTVHIQTRHQSAKFVNKILNGTVAYIIINCQVLTLASLSSTLLGMHWAKSTHKPPRKSITYACMIR